MSGFGSALNFATPAGAPVGGLTSVDFAFDPASAIWAINGNRSPAAQLRGECQVASAAWSLPVKRNPTAAFAEAAHGGTLSARLLDGVDVVLDGMCKREPPIPPGRIWALRRCCGCRRWSRSPTRADSLPAAPSDALETCSLRGWRASARAAALLAGTSICTMHRFRATLREVTGT